MPKKPDSAPLAAPKLPSEGRVQVEILVATAIGSNPVMPGEIHECSIDDAQHLVRVAKARIVPANSSVSAAPSV